MIHLNDAAKIIQFVYIYAKINDNFTENNGVTFCHVL